MKKTNKTEISHSKLKNTGILFELLTYQVTHDLLKNVADSKAIKILQTNFRKGTELQKEISLYKYFIQTTNKRPENALNAINTIIEQRERHIDANKLNKEKYRLVRDIKESYDIDDFFNKKIGNYKLYASIYKMFKAKEENLMNISDIIKCKDTVLEHMTQTTSGKKDILSEFKQLSKEDKILTYRVLLEKFNTKFNGLNSKQKKLLREYILNTTNPKKLKEIVKTEYTNFKTYIQENKTKLDKPIQIKLSELFKQIDELGKGRDVRDKDIYTMMMCYQLEDEIKEQL